MSDSQGNIGSTGKKDFDDGKYADAINRFTEAVELLSLDTQDEELSAVLFSSTATANFRLSQAEGVPQDEVTRLLTVSLQDAQKAIEVDPKNEKAHVRCALLLWKLDEDDPQIYHHFDKVLELYRADDKSYMEDHGLMDVLSKTGYLNAKMRNSPNWERVKFKDNCILCDFLFNDLSVFIIDMLIGMKEQWKQPVKVSFLIEPGSYQLEHSIFINDDCEVDIVGNIRTEKDEVIISCSNMHLLFVLGGTLKVEQITLRQTGDHPTDHVANVMNSSKVTFIRCKFYSKRSASVAITDNSNAKIRGCKFEQACGAIVIVSGGRADITQCKFIKTRLIALEMRDGGSATVKTSEFVESGSQAIVCHAEATGFLADNCMFYNNQTRMAGRNMDMGVINISSGRGDIKNSQFNNNQVGGVMVQSGGFGLIEKCHFSGGGMAVAFSELGGGKVSGCTVRNTNKGFPILFNQGGKVTLENNDVQTKKPGYQVFLGPKDQRPEIIGEQLSVHQDTNSKPTKADLRRIKQAMKGDKFSKDKMFADPGQFTADVERKCSPCGMSQRALGKHFLRCGGCKLIYYCSKECQKKDWKLHKPSCKMTQELLKKSSS